jgi:hypothetical protein
LLVYGAKFNGSDYIQIDGKAEVIEHPRAMDIVLDWHRKIRGVPDNWDDIRRRPYPKAASPSASPSKGPARRVEDKHTDLIDADPLYFP